MFRLGKYAELNYLGHVAPTFELFSINFWWGINGLVIRLAKSNKIMSSMAVRASQAILDVGLV
jgi:hypothetical protein